MSLKLAFNTSFDEDDSSDNFDVRLFKLMRRADEVNLFKLSQAFPEHYRIHDGWKRFGLDYTNNEILTG